MKIKRPGLLIGIGLLLAVPSLAAPQDPAQGQAAAGSEEDPESRFEENIVVTASIEPEEKRDTPASVTVVGREEIAARQSTEALDLLATTPGAILAQSGSPGQQASLFIRGSESDQTLVLWNGVELNEPFFGGFNWAFLPTEGVERIEIVRGPFSTLYGSDALGGVVQVFTGDLDGAALSMEGGEDNYYRTGLAAGHGFGRTRLDASGHVRRGDGQFKNDFYDSDELTARVETTLRPGVTLGLLGRANNSDTGIPFAGDQPTLHRRISAEERQVAVPFNADLGPWSVRAQASLVQLDNEFRDPEDPSGFTASSTDSEAQRGRASLSYKVDEDTWFGAGADYERAEVTNSSSFGVNLDGESQRTWAVFAQVHSAFGPLVIDLGARRDDNNNYGSKVTPRFGFSWRIGGGRLWGSYAEGFRAPSLGELFFPFSGNPDLQPETSESYELGIEVGRSGWTAGLIGFENRQENLIDFDLINFRNINVGRARSRGVEAEAGYSGKVFGGRWSGTYLDAEDRAAGLPLLRRPEKSSSLVLTARPGKWTFSATGLYVGERPDVDPVTFERRTNPSYTRFDLAARWQALPWLAPYGRVRNVADREYQEALGFSALGRTLIGGLAVTF